jgi:hypothetical protein
MRRLVYVEVRRLAAAVAERFTCLGGGRADDLEQVAEPVERRQEAQVEQGRVGHVTFRPPIASSMVAGWGGGGAASIRFPASSPTVDERDAQASHDSI